MNNFLTKTWIFYLFFITWFVSLSSGGGINLTYMVSENKMMMMIKCEVTDDACCRDPKKAEFFKDGESVCLFKNCKPYFDIPFNGDTRFYRCGCSAGDMRKTHFITTEFRNSDLGNWSCGCDDNKSCKSDAITISLNSCEEKDLCGMSSNGVHGYSTKHSDKSKDTRTTATEGEAVPVSLHDGHVCSDNSYLSPLLFFVGMMVAFLICGVYIFILKRISCVTVGRSTCLSKMLCLKVRDNKELNDGADESIKLQVEE